MQIRRIRGGKVIGKAITDPESLSRLGGERLQVSRPIVLRRRIFVVFVLKTMLSIHSWALPLFHYCLLKDKYAGSPA
jgi:hypothetical protein